MATFTTNYNITKPAKTERFSLATWNSNSDKIDTAIKNVETSIAASVANLAGAGRTTETVKTTNDNLVSHVGSTANPHGVTASQVNAYSKTELQTSGQAQVHWGNLTNMPTLGDSSWKAAVATPAALPLTGNTVGDMRIVINDGDNKSSIYVCIATVGVLAMQWDKIGDVDFAIDWADLTGKPAVLVNTTASFTTVQESKLLGIAESANNYAHPNHSGDITSTGDGATVIGLNKVANTMLAQVATSTIKGRVTAATGNVEDLTAANVRTIITDASNRFVTDTQITNFGTAYSHSQAAHAPSTAEQNVQSDWNQATDTADDFIKNKPTIIALGSTETTAFRGDYGNTAYSHSQATHMPIGLGTAISGTSGSLSVTMDGTVKTLAPTAACTLNATGGIAGQSCCFVITAQNTDSNVITFGTNFRTTDGVAVTLGNTAGDTAVIDFIYDGSNWYEKSRELTS